MTRFNRHLLLETTLEYGKATWQKLKSECTSNNLTPLLSLSLIIEYQLQHLTDLCKLYPDVPNQHKNPNIVALKQFYMQTEIKYHPKMQPLSSSLAIQIHSPTQFMHNNYYSVLENYIFTPKNITTYPKMSTTAPTTTNDPTDTPKSYFVEDLGIAELTNIINGQKLQDDMRMEEDEGVEPTPMAPSSIELTLSTPTLHKNNVSHPS